MHRPADFPSFPRCDEVPAWGALQAHFDGEGRGLDLRQAFAQDAGRFEAFSQNAPHLFADLSRNLIDGKTESLLLQLAAQCRLAEQRDAMFAGARVNGTEARAGRHWLLR